MVMQPTRKVPLPKCVRLPERHGWHVTFADGLQLFMHDNEIEGGQDPEVAALELRARANL